MKFLVDFSVEIKWRYSSEKKKKKEKKNKTVDFAYNNQKVQKKIAIQNFFDSFWLRRKKKSHNLYGIPVLS